jgi:hypothetical protein
MQMTPKPIDTVWRALKAHGMLLKQDKRVPSVVGIVTGESLRGSWWGHPQSHQIFSILAILAEDEEIVLTKLLHRKDTLIHRQLWPALLAVGRARAPWQLVGLSNESLRLLNLVDRSNAMRATGSAVKELQCRLLITAHEVHGNAGRHEVALESWTRWADRVACTALASSTEGRDELERAAASLGAPVGWLPWASLPRSGARDGR